MALSQFLLSISLLGILQGVLISLLLLLRSSKMEPGSRMLGTLFFLCSLAMALVTLVNANFVVETPLIRAIEYGVGLFSGPIIYFCVKLYAHQRMTDRNMALHLTIPILFIFGKGLSWLLSAPFDLPILLIMLYMQGYILASLLLYWKVRKQSPSPTPHPLNHWIPILLSFFIFMAFAQWSRFFLSDWPSLKLIVPSAVSLNFYVLTLFGFRRSALLKEVFKPKKKEPTLSLPGKVTLGRLQTLMVDQQLFTNHDLTVLSSWPINWTSTPIDCPN